MYPYQIECITNTVSKKKYNHKYFISHCQWLLQKIQCPMLSMLFLKNYKNYLFLN